MKRASSDVQIDMIDMVQLIVYRDHVLLKKLPYTWQEKVFLSVPSIDSSNSKKSAYPVSATCTQDQAQPLRNPPYLRSQSEFRHR
jgi:hypothetical protein